MSWLPPPRDIALEPEAVHIWRVPLTAGDREVELLAGALSDFERARATRFRFDYLRKRFVIAHAGLRIILGRYTGVSAPDLNFAYTEYGKPFLPGDGLHFNLSHAEEVALVAVTRMGEIGVDVEWIRPGMSGGDIAERYFSRREAAALRAMPREAQSGAFFDCWTRKEAFIKAMGHGLSHPLDAFDVAFAPGQPAALLAIQGSEADAAGWTLKALAPGDGYAGAVALYGKPATICHWQFPIDEETGLAWKREKTAQSTKL